VKSEKAHVEVRKLDFEEVEVHDQDMPMPLVTPPPRKQLEESKQSEAPGPAPQRASVPTGLLEQRRPRTRASALPEQLLLDSNGKLPWAWRLSLQEALDSPVRSESSENAQAQVETESPRCLSMQFAGAAEGPPALAARTPPASPAGPEGRSRSPRLGGRSSSVPVDGCSQEPGRGLEAPEAAPLRRSLPGKAEAKEVQMTPRPLQERRLDAPGVQPSLFSTAWAQTRQRSRSPRRSSGSEQADDLANSKEPERRQRLYILDGLNILRKRNRANMFGGEVPLEWEQLQSACRYYTSRGHQVSVFLPPLRVDQEPMLDVFRQRFGDIFVLCQSASDDRFMINTAKLHEAEVQKQASDPETEPSCFIVTNDRFEDWRRRGDVDSAWVERHCVRFAFGPGGFIPSELA